MAVVTHQLVIATVTYPHTQDHTRDQARQNSCMTGRPWKPCPYCKSCGRLIDIEGGAEGESVAFEDVVTGRLLLLQWRPHIQMGGASWTWELLIK